MATSTSSVWQLKGQQAALRVGALSATVDLTQPAQGLATLEWLGTSLGQAQVLGVQSHFPGDPFPLEDHYVRVDDLVATYAQTATRPMRVQTYWRVASPADRSTAVAIDLQVSVQTNLLDSRPELTAHSVLPAAQAFALADAAGKRFAPLTATTKSTIKRIPADGPGCWLFRIAGAAASYAEMVHPADFAEMRLTGSEQDVSVAHGLFGTWLEKGVILRSRLRGVFLPREDDERLAAESYAAFLAEEPPLTT